MERRSAVPADLATAASPKLASPQQITFLRALANEREIPADARTDLLARCDSGEITRSRASDFIKRLLEKPKVDGAKTFARFEEVPDGRYALRFPADDLNPIHFYSVRTSDFGNVWDGYQAVKRHSSDERYRVHGEQRIFVLKQIIEAGPRESAELFGRETNHCGVCGRELTREDSRARGIGPDCAERLGWL